MGDEWRRYAAPAAFLLAVTIAVVLIRSGLESGGGTSGQTTSTAARTTTHKRVVATTPTTTRKKPTAGKAYWTVRAGDTFGVISSKTGVPVATLERLNPNASSTSLFIGERIRYR